MSRDPQHVPIYHITDVDNLRGILDEDGLHSDVAMKLRNSKIIGYEHIKQRRMEEIRVDCQDGRFVGEFVPFYFCPRSPMLYTVNLGKTGRPPGCQKSIIHLVSSVAAGIQLKRPWAFSDGNAGTFHTSFYSELDALDRLDWQAIEATYWQGQTHQKAAEFLVADFFPWLAVQSIACHNTAIAKQVRDMLINSSHRPEVIVRPDWYYPHP